MYLREEPKQTLKDVRSECEETGVVATLAPLNEVRVDLETDNLIHIKTVGDINFEVPANEVNLHTVGSYLGIPDSFLDRLDADLKGTLMNGMLDKVRDGEVVFRHNDDFIKSIRTPGQQGIEPFHILDVAMGALTEDAPVVHWDLTPASFRLDTIVTDASRHIGGDRHVGDITKGGLRFEQNRKQNLAPAVSRYIYRLICTNGMEQQDASLKVDARGSSFEEVMADFAVKVNDAMSGLDNMISAHYDLRNNPVENPERVINRLAREHKLSDRFRTRLIDAAASDMLPDDPSEFDVVNLITNFGNEPSVASRDGARRILEQMGGTIVTEHVARCGHCQARLS